MKKMTSFEIKSELLNMLKEFDKLCDQKGYHYYLAYGTLIGAIREKGFIPWDDDIDIHMPRKDYAKLVENINNKVLPNINVISAQTDNSFSNHAKIYYEQTYFEEPSLEYSISSKYKYGLFIDIFPLDGLPLDITIRRRFLKKILFLKKMRSYKITKTDYERLGLLKSFCRNTIKILIKPISLKFIVNKIEKMCKTYDYDVCDEVSNLSLSYSTWVYKKKWFGNGKDSPFEGYPVKVPNEYDKVLKAISDFGDYMVVPEKKDRRPPHGNYYYI